MVVYYKNVPLHRKQQIWALWEKKVVPTLKHSWSKQELITINRDWISGSIGLRIPDSILAPVLAS